MYETGFGKAGNKSPIAKIDVVINNPKGPVDLRYVLSFTEVGQRFEIVDERIENESPDQGHKKPYLYYKFENGHGVLNVRGGSAVYSTKILTRSPLFFLSVKTQTNTLSLRI